MSPQPIHEESRELLTNLRNPQKKMVHKMDVAYGVEDPKFSRVLGVLLGLFLPLMLVLVLIDVGMGERTQGLPGAATQVQMVAAAMHARQTLPLTCGLGFLFSPLVIALLAGASVSAWRTLKDEPSVEILA